MSSVVGDSVLSQQRDCSYHWMVAGETLLTYSRSLMNCLWVEARFLHGGGQTPRVNLRNRS